MVKLALLIGDDLQRLCVEGVCRLREAADEAGLRGVFDRVSATDLLQLVRRTSTDKVYVVAAGRAAVDHTADLAVCESERSHFVSANGRHDLRFGRNSRERLAP